MRHLSQLNWKIRRYIRGTQIQILDPTYYCKSNSIFPEIQGCNNEISCRKSSDDPLISGVTQDHHNDSEFPVITVSKSPLPPISPLTKVKKATKIRRKPQFKLRFHHQALPPEYLDHYEASQHNLQRDAKAMPPPDTQKANESVRSWLQKINDAQKETQKDAEMSTASTKPSKIVSYKDLPYMGEMTLDNSKPRRGRKPKKADICHLIYKNYGTIFPDNPENLKAKLEPKKQENEPLNLCVRDTSADTLIVSSSEDESLESSRATTPLLSPGDLSTDTTLATNLRMSLPNFQSALVDTPSPTETPSTADREQLSSPGNGYVYLPNAGVFIHPMALYYQKMVDASTANPSAIWKPDDKVSEKQEPQRLVPKNISKLMQEPPKVQPGPSSEESQSSSKCTTPTPKRKRSAIFIPPVPTEPKSHATEVSICKFKFTGGAKPSLQEKKILSVDAGGNMRYYSGTGDKSMRGYEFFPRESLAQSSLTSNTTTSAFLNAASEKMDLPPPSHGLSNELLQIPEFPSTSAVPIPISPMKSHRSDKKKRKSRRSIQREKLEKTFKEKGFLIQTQQRQSAEGATYCKFRQLKKFTRYLFRSWKDHLPPNELQGQLLDPNGGPNLSSEMLINRSPSIDLGPNIGTL